MDKIYTNIQSWGSTIYVRYLENGKKLQERITDFHPRVWIPTSSASTKTDYKNLQDYPVIEFDAGNIKETREFIERNRGVGNFAVYGNIQPQYQWISQNCAGSIPWKTSDIIIAYIDIECTCENGFPSITDAAEEINAITIKFSNLEKKIVLGFDHFSGEIDNAIFIPCETEEILLDKFLKVWKSNYPDIVSGWHVKFFDIPYLINRIARVFGESKTKCISPWNILREETVEVMGKKVQTYDMFGIAILDYLDLYKKFTYSAQESYKLDYIASVELGEKKLDYSEHGSLHLLYKEDYNKFIQYNAKDVDLVVSLENKMKLIELAMTMAYDAKVNFDDVFSQVRMWDVIIYNHLLSKGYVIPDRQESRKEEIEGAYVKEPKPGFYNWVVSFDLQSLYPHLIMGGNFSPDTIVDKIIPGVSVDGLLTKSVDLTNLKEKNYSMSATGQLYTRDKYGFLAELMSWMFEQRKIYKTKMIQAEKDLEEAKKTGQDTSQIINDISKYKNLQMAKKIALNSAYGAICNRYCRYSDKRIAESITITGQLAIRWISNRLNEYLQNLLKTKKDYVIAADTDSCILNLEDVVTKFFPNKTKEQIIDLIDETCQVKLQKVINDSYEDLAVYLNSYSQKMIMKREAIADRGIGVNSGSTATPAIATLDELDVLITALDKQGAMPEYAMYVNRLQDLAIDDMIAQGTSTAANITAGVTTQFGQFANAADMVKLGFSSFMRGSYTFHKHSWKLLNDPTLLGASNFQGVMIPLTNVADPRTGEKSPALELNYKATNGYNREMEHWMTGSILGVTNTNTDALQFNYRSEFALVTRAANQHVLLTK